MDVYEELFTTIEKRKDDILEVLDFITNMNKACEATRYSERNIIIK